MNSKVIHILNSGKSDATEKRTNREAGENVELRVNDMNEFPLVLHDCIKNYAHKKTIQNGRYVQGHEDIAALLGYAPQTIYKWTNPSNPTFPPVNLLLAMCTIMDDFTPWEFFVTYAQQLKESRNK